MILDITEMPVPPSEIARRLQRLFGDDLELRWSPVERCWHVCWKWPPHHRGWAMVQRQEIPASKAFDIVGRLPKDCPLDSAPAYLERALRTWPEHEVQQMANAITRWNETKPTEQAIESALEDVLGGDPTAPSPEVLEAAGIRAPKGRKRR